MLIARNHHDLPHNERGALHPRQDVHEAQDPRDREGDAEGRERDADEAIPGGVTVGQRVLLPEGAASSADGDEAGSTGGTTDGR